MKVLKLFYTVPVFVLLFSVFSFTEKTHEMDQQLIVGEIHFEGNTKYSDARLYETLGIKTGDNYVEENVKNLLNYDPDNTTISDLYMDTGHLFFSITLEEDVLDNKVNLNFKIYEGALVSIDKIIVSGNQKVENKDILAMIEIKKGDLFNRSELIASQKNIAESGYFKPDNVGINPIPHDARLVDIEFVVEELNP